MYSVHGKASTSLPSLTSLIFTPQHLQYYYLTSPKTPDPQQPYMYTCTCIRICTFACACFSPAEQLPARHE